jgi:epsilon-lactone hydrolase
MGLRLLVHGLRALAVVVLRRSRGERLRPSWPFRFEVVVELMRVHSRWLAKLEPEALRRAANDLAQPLPPNITLHLESIAGVPCTWFTPPEAAREILVFVHGGAYVFGSAQQARGNIAELALRTRRRVVAPDYRLAPEHPWPAAPDDLALVYRALLDRGLSPQAIGVAGESAGAGVALSALQRLRDARVPLPSSCVLLSPAVDLCADSPSWTTNRGVDYGDPSSILAWNRMYAGTHALTDASVSPLRADCSGLPRLLVVAGTAELLVDDARALAAKAREAGVATELVLGEDMVHAYPAFGSLAPHAEAAWQAIERFLRA